MRNTRDEWTSRLRKLNPNVSKAKGEGKARFAPHKALLLLCVLDLAENGELAGAVLPKSPELRLRFDSYWRIVDVRWGGKPNLDLPFYHLGTQGFWTARTRTGQRAESPESTAAVNLDEGFLVALGDREWRDLARRILVETWFPEVEQAALYVALGFSAAKVRQLGYRTKQEGAEYQAKGRDARFRVIVVTQYRFTCALTGYGLHTSKGATLVEAAHIHAFSQSRNDSPENGLALSRDAHWMFDEGLWTATDSLRVRVAREIFTEWGPEAAWLKARDDKPLTFLDGVVLRPAREHLAWHRTNKFADRSAGIRTAGIWNSKWTLARRADPLHPCVPHLRVLCIAPDRVSRPEGPALAGVPTLSRCGLWSYAPNLEFKMRGIRNGTQALPRRPDDRRRQRPTWF